jgi:hypothetical protein
MENQKGRTVKCIQSDNGTENINNDFTYSKNVESPDD